MDEFRVKGIVINSIDYKDNDKLLTIYSLELGKISAVLKGVKSPKAKLKFAGQLFCFAEFMLVKRGEYFTVTNASQIESFFEISSNYNKFLVGQIILEIVNIIMQPNQINERYFVQILKALKELCNNESNENSIIVKFLLITFDVMGYAINFTHCVECNSLLHNELFFNFDIGFISCKNCARLNSFQLQKKDFNVLKIINNSNVENLNGVKVSKDDLFEVVAVLGKNFENRFNKKIKTLNNFYLI